jgi:serine/threonine protein kinase
LTQTGMMIGTPNYMSPEQFMGQPVDGRSDLFSAGIIFYQFVTGENPFDGRSMVTVMHKVLSLEPLEPYKLNLQVSSELNDVIKKALAKRPEDRFETAEAFNRAIAEAYKGGSSVPQQPSPESTTGYTQTVIITDQTAEKKTPAPISHPQEPFDPYKTFNVTSPEMETIAPADTRTIPPSPKPAATETGTTPPAFSPRLRWAILCGIIILLAAGLIMNLDRFTRPKPMAAPVLPDNQPSVAKQPIIPSTEIAKTDEPEPEPEQKQATDTAEKSQTEPPMPVSTETVRREPIPSVAASVPSPAPLKKPAKKTGEKENTLAEKEADSSLQPADGVDAEENKEKTDTPKKDTSATAKAKRKSCKEIYLKISLGEKLTAEEQRIINNCR